MTSPETATTLVSPPQGVPALLKIILVVIVVSVVGIWWSKREPAEKRCRRVYASLVITQLSKERADQQPGSAILKPPSDRDIQWHDKHCYNGKLMQ